MNTRNIIIMVSIISSVSVQAQEERIKLWEGEIPNEINDASYKEWTSKENNIMQVSEPTLSIFFPNKEKANGTAVIICPGGGYSFLSFENEGYQVASWLNDLGITAFILKYRLPNDAIMKDKSIAPLQDAQRAMRLIRSQAQKWNINPEKIGVMGFSAGGHLAASLATHFDEKLYAPDDSLSSRPDFSILVYPVITMKDEYAHQGSKRNLLGNIPDKNLVVHFSNELWVTANTPPTFLVHAADDKTVPVENSMMYFSSLKNNDVPCELHIYQKGGHGFALKPSESTETSWTKACELWMKMMDIL